MAQLLLISGANYIYGLRGVCFINVHVKSDLMWLAHLDGGSSSWHIIMYYYFWIIYYFLNKGYCLIFVQNEISETPRHWNVECSSVLHRVSCPMVIPFSAIVRPQKNFDLYKFGQFYINKHITNDKLHKF